MFAFREQLDTKDKDNFFVNKIKLVFLFAAKRDFCLFLFLSFQND